MRKGLQEYTDNFYELFIRSKRDGQTIAGDGVNLFRLRLQAVPSFLDINDIMARHSITVILAESIYKFTKMCRYYRRIEQNQLNVII